MKKRKITAAIIVGITLLAICLSMMSCSQIREVVNLNLIEYDYFYGTVTSSINGKIKTNYKGDDVKCEYTLFNGTFANDPTQKRITRSVDETICWLSLKNGQKENPLPENQCWEDYVTIIIKVGTNIVGYSVLHMFTFERADYFIQLVASFEFPKINSRYQNISEQYVREQIKQFVIFTEGLDND